VPSERCSIEEPSIEYIVDERVVSSDMVRGDLRSPRTTPLEETRLFKTFYRLLLN
jgi:hypothetical protein